MGKLDGRVALVTGAASGLGKASAYLFVREGAAVIFADLNERNAHAAADEASQHGGMASALRLDVTSAEACEQAVAETIGRYGRLDILMTSAGLGDSAPVADLDAETFRRVMDVNVTGTFLTARAALPALARQGGNIVTVGSIAGLKATAGFAAYGASKAAVIHLTRILALEGVSQGVRANTICPSWVWTPMVEQAMRRMMPGATPEQARARLARFSPSGTLVTPDAVAQAALYLACDESAFVNGHALVVDSGLSIRG